MITPLDNAFDEHWIYVHRCQETTFNIVVRTLIDHAVSESQLERTASALVAKHPYIVGKVVEDPKYSYNCRFYLDSTEDLKLSTQIESTDDGCIDTLMTQPSARRTYSFNLEMGELAHIHIWRSANRSLIELSCAHLVGDVTAILLLNKDLLTFLDQAILKQTTLVTETSRRLPFDEKRYGWIVETKEVTPLPLPSGAPVAPNKWPAPHFLYGRYSMHTEQFHQIKHWLEKREINAKVTDLFYYLTSLIYSINTQTKLNFSVVLSFRHLLDNADDKNNINTSAVFSLINTSDNSLNDVKGWLHDLYESRNRAASHEGIMGLMHFLRCLNRSLYDTDPMAGRALLNAYLPIDLFAFNNFGNVDGYFEGYKTFRTLDVDIQDGVPCQEVRLFTLRETLHVNPMLAPDGPFTPESFWCEFSNRLKTLTA